MCVRMCWFGLFPFVLLVFPCPSCPVSGLSMQAGRGWNTSDSCSHLHTLAAHSRKSTHPPALLKSPAPSPTPRQFVLEPHVAFIVPAIVFATALRKDFCYMVLGFLFWTSPVFCLRSCLPHSAFLCLFAGSRHWLKSALDSGCTIW